MTETATRQRHAANTLAAWYRRIHELGDTVAVITRDRHVATGHGAGSMGHSDYIVDWPRDPWFGGRSPRGGFVEQAAGGRVIGFFRQPPGGWKDLQEVAAAAVQVLRAEGVLAGGDDYTVAVLCECSDWAEDGTCLTCHGLGATFPAI